MPGCVGQVYLLGDVVHLRMEGIEIHGRLGPVLAKHEAGQADPVGVFPLGRLGPAAIDENKVIDQRLAAEVREAEYELGILLDQDGGHGEESSGQANPVRFGLLEIAQEAIDGEFERDGLNVDAILLCPLLKELPGLLIQGEGSP